jgi:uncharacterized NAD(P)/FAD-binding protein YdhS
MTRHVVIIGGGATGAAAFVALARAGAAPRIDVVDPGPVGLGKAFATTEAALLCNTSVDTLSLLAGEPDDFLHYLRGRGFDATRHDCVPRYQFAQYVRDRYDQAVASGERRGLAHAHVRGIARAVRRIGHGRYRVVLDDGRDLPASDVLICAGFGRPMVPPAIEPHLGAHLERSLVFATPYPEGAVLAALPPRSRVLVVGTRLSAIDAALLLCSQGHAVVMASRSGELPSVRTRTSRTVPSPIDEAAFARLDFADPGMAVRLLRVICKASAARAGRPLSAQIDRSADPAARLRAEIELAAADLCDWQDVLVNFLDLGNEVFHSVAPAVRRLAIERCSSMIMRYLFAMPVRNARLLLGHIDAGALRVIAGTPAQLARGADWHVTWSADTPGRSPGAADRAQRFDHFDAVICASGFHKPRFHATRGGVEIAAAPWPHATVEPSVSPDLRMTLPDTDGPERIWTLGVASYLGTPLVNAVYQAAQQADAVARQLVAERRPLHDDRPEWRAAPRSHSPETG